MRPVGLPAFAAAVLAFVLCTAPSRCDAFIFTKDRKTQDPSNEGDDLIDERTFCRYTYARARHATAKIIVFEEEDRLQHEDVISRDGTASGFSLGPGTPRVMSSLPITTWHGPAASC